MDFNMNDMNDTNNQINSNNIIIKIESFLQTTKITSNSQFGNLIKELITNFGKEYLFKLFESNLQQKIFVYIRHAESVKNEKKKLGIYHKENIIENYDPIITQKGKEECIKALDKLNEIKINFDIVYISPLSRAIQTFAELKQSNYFTNKNNNYIISPLIRETLKNSTQVGSRLSQLRTIYNNLELNFDYIIKEKWWNFEKIENEDVNQIENIIGETEPDVLLRVRIFLIWCVLRKESNICIIAHSNIYCLLTSQREHKLKNAEVELLKNEGLLENIKSILQ